ncbi:hypothetical protein Tco_0754418 [Tanacetum coccineum]
MLHKRHSLKYNQSRPGWSVCSTSNGVTKETQCANFRITNSKRSPKASRTRQASTYRVDGGTTVQNVDTPLTSITTTYFVSEGSEVLAHIESPSLSESPLSFGDQFWSAAVSNGTPIAIETADGNANSLYQHLKPTVSELCNILKFSVYESNHESTLAAGLIHGPCEVLPPSKFTKETGV